MHPTFSNNEINPQSNDDLKVRSEADLKNLTHEELVNHALKLQDVVLNHKVKTKTSYKIVCDKHGNIKELSQSFLEGFNYDNNSAFIANPGYIYDLLPKEECLKITDWIKNPNKIQSIHKAHVRFLDGNRQYRWVAMELAYKSIDKKLCIEVEISLLPSNQLILDKLYLFEKIILNIDDAVLVTEAQPINHPGPRILYVNDAFTRMTGYTLEEVKGKSPRILQGPETNRKVLDRIRTALTNWTPIEVELINYRKDGSKFDVNFSLTPLADENGYYTHWVAVQRDITHKRHQEVIHGQLATAVKNTQNNIIITDKEGKIEYANPSFEKLTGYTLAEIKGKTPGEILKGEKTSSMTRKLIRTALKSQNTFHGEIFNYTKDGRGYWNEILIDPVTNANNELVGFVGVQSDVTTRNEISRRLYAQNKLLKQVNEELDQFVYSVSHDLRAPLASMLGLLQIIQIEDSEEEKNNYLKYIEENILKLDRFIHDINDFAKNSRLELHFQKIDLNTLVNDITQSLYYLPSTKASKVSINIEDGVKVVSDLRRLRIILSNLLSNAFKYSRYQNDIKPIIQINVARENNMLSIQVTDNGIGIEEEYLPKIFNMFYQANKEAKGTGLGLYIVKQAILKLAGKIHVTSAVGKGTTFTLTLPLLK